MIKGKILDFTPVNSENIRLYKKDVKHKILMNHLKYYHPSKAILYPEYTVPGTEYRPVDFCLNEKLYPWIMYEAFSSSYNLNGTQYCKFIYFATSLLTGLGAYKVKYNFYNPDPAWYRSDFKLNSYYFYHHVGNSANKNFKSRTWQQFYLTSHLFTKEDPTMTSNHGQMDNVVVTPAVGQLKNLNQNVNNLTKLFFLFPLMKTASIKIIGNEETEIEIGNLNFDNIKQDKYYFGWVGKVNGFKDKSFLDPTKKISELEFFARHALITKSVNDVSQHKDLNIVPTDEVPTNTVNTNIVPFTLVDSNSRLKSGITRLEIRYVLADEIYNYIVNNFNNTYTETDFAGTIILEK